MRIFLFFVISFFYCDTANAQIEYPSGVSATTDNDLKDLVWNRYTTDNFVILSIDDAQGKWLSENIETIRKWCLSRWGFPEDSHRKFSKECRIFCVPDKQLLKKLFSLGQAKTEIRKKDNQLNMTVMWLVLDDKPSKIISPYLTQVCLAEFESTNNVSFGFWFKRGASLLNGTVPDVRQQMVDLSNSISKNRPMFTSEKMFTLKEDEYLEESVENKKIFDQESVALCIMLRKEFGEAKLQGMLRISSKNNPQDVLRVVYGFSGYSHFDKRYIQFMRDLTGDVVREKTPDAYLDIKSVR